MSPNDPQAQPIKDRLQAAWAALTPDERAQIKPLFEAANDQHIALRTAGQIIEPDPAIPHNLLLAKSAITNDWDGLLDAAGAVPLEIKLATGPEGQIYGFKKYEELDARWLESVACWLENLHNIYSPFPSDSPPVITIPDDVTIAMGGDWGTGDWRGGPNPSPSARVAAAITALKPNVTIHLGDVYYAGTNDEEADNLLQGWPAGTPDASLTFTLNSNHEMYSGANPFFKITLASHLFNAQNGYSYFALQNANWVIVCLDSAYASEAINMYADGKLNTAQQIFLMQQADKGKKVIVVTHHNGYADNTDGTQTQNPFWTQIMACFPTGKSPAYWYWGHVHTGVVYKVAANGTLCRCTGHAAIPWANAKILEPALANGSVVWYENTPAGDADIPQRVLNGFTLLHLKDATITEAFINENGKTAWPV